MKIFLSRFVLVLAMLSSSHLAALDVPAAPTQWVTDGAGILQAQELTALNDKLRAFEERSGSQFIIYIFPSLEEESLEDFSIRAAEQWKAGQAKYDNGLILLVFMKEQRVRVEVGYGLEGAMTDAYSSRVIRNFISPDFQRGQYGAGLNAAADAIIARIEGNEVPVPVARERGSGGIISLGPPFLILLFFLFFVLPLLMRRGGCGGCGGCIPLPLFFPTGGTTFGGRGGFGGGGGGFGGGFGGFSGGGGGFGGGGASGGW